jgi:hypothetical protein
MSVTDWRDAKYDEVFTETLHGLEGRRHDDVCFTVTDAEGVLHHLYIQEGNDWLGRGELQDAILGATIAAYECFINAWKAAPQPPSNEESVCQ